MSDMRNPATGGGERIAGQMQTASPVQELSAEQTNISIDGDVLAFETTADLEPLDEIVGQDRAMSALEVGLGIRQEGYNIFVAGLTGTGKMGTIRRSLEKRLAGSKVPDDWVYVFNFDERDRPWAIRLKPGQGRQLEKDMKRLVEALREALPKAFRQEDFGQQKEELGRKYEERMEEQANRLRELAKERGFEIEFQQEGQVRLVPIIEGKPAEKQEQLDNLPEERKQQMSEAEKELAREVGKITSDQRRMMQKLREEVRDAERQFAEQVVAPMIDALKRKYEGDARLQEYLGRVAEHVLDNISDFRRKRGTGSGDGAPPQLQAMLGGGPQAEPTFLEYQVNVIVDNAHADAAPIVVEETPTYRNLFGSIDQSVDRSGRLTTDFTQIKAGSLLRANGGYLVFNIEDALTEPFVYKSLKRALKSGCLQLESYNAWLPFSMGGLRPEPIPLNTKVVVVGNPMVYYLLRFYDDEFGSIFKIRAEFGTDMPRHSKEQMQYARFVAAVTRDEGLRPFHRGAVEEVIRFGARQVGDKMKLLTRFSETADLIREADYFARMHDAQTVEASHVREALENRIYRSNRIEERIRELIEDGTLLVDVEGATIGQVNGLAVISLGDYMFGKPSRLTASVGIGSDGLINIERESKLSGSTHDKGMLILAGYVRNMYGRNRPITLSASITFEQTYSGVDGDSASSVELYALLSALSGTPLRQDIAVTGSVNQWGQIQAIGGVNEKVEGFFDVCRSIGLTGQQGVCIPRSNVKNLLLRDDVRDAIAKGRFHIWPIATVNEGLELLTGVRAGSPEEEGTIHHRVHQRLGMMAETLRGFGRAQDVKVPETGVMGPQPPAPPKMPGDQP